MTENETKIWRENEVIRYMYIEHVEYMKDLSSEQVFSPALRYYGVCVVLACTLQLWTIDSSA